MSNVSDLASLFTFVNEQTGFWFGNSILFMVFIISFWTMKDKMTTSRSFVAGAWVTAVVGVLLRVLGLLGDFAMGFSIALVLLGYLWLSYDESR